MPSHSAIPNSYLNKYYFCHTINKKFILVYNIRFGIHNYVKFLFSVKEQITSKP